MSGDQVLRDAFNMFLATVMVVLVCGVGLFIAYAILEFRGGDR